MQVSTISIKDVRVGDRVKVVDGSFALVQHVVRIARKAGKKLVVFDDYSGLQITPRHPIFLQEQWVLPIDCVDEKHVKCIDMEVDHTVYNLFLEEGKHTLLVDGIACATWGHELEG